MQPQMNHYARMKFTMGSTVTANGTSAVITGWSTNGDAGEDTTYCYQLNTGGELVQETELSLVVVEPTQATQATSEASEATPEASEATPEASEATPEATQATPEATQATPEATETQPEAAADETP